MAKAKSTSSTSPEQVTDILKVMTGAVDCHIVGTSPLILNRMSEKAKHELLLPHGRKSAVEKATTLKHNPIDEFRASPYVLPEDDAPTYLAHLATSFKRAMSNAAKDMPGTNKSQIGRLTWVVGERVPLFGVPKLLMSVVRSADMNRTPDIRSRAILPEWACVIRIAYVQPLIRTQAVANLLAAAGITQGTGDWRQEKGSGSYGQFRIADKDDPEFKRIVKAGGRSVQIDAMENPSCYDDETTELLSWFQEERQRRQLKGVAA
jgi:hypothetical protein